LIGLALLTRLTYVFQWQHAPTFSYPIVDEAYLDGWARAIAAGNSFVSGPYFRAPLYPAFLAAIYKVFGPGYVWPRIVQAVLGAASCGLVFLIGREAFGRVVATLAGLIAATYWTLIFFDGELLAASLSVFLGLLLIWLLLRAGRRPSWKTFGAAGLMLGLAGITRPDVLLMGPAIVVWLAIRFRHQRRSALKFAACVTAGCLAIVLPVTVRNYVAGRDLVLIAWQGGLNFYIGNNPLTDGRTAVAPGMVLDPHGAYDEAIAFAERAEGRPLKPSQVSDYFYGQGWEFIKANPRQALALTLLKARLFWSSWEIANNKNLYFWTERFAPLVRFLPLGFGVIGPLGLLGMTLCWRRRLELFPLWGSILVYMAAVVPFFSAARFRLPIVPVLIVLGAWAAVAGYRALRERQWRSLLAGATVLCLAGVLVNVTPHQQPRPQEDVVSLATLGDVYQDVGRPDLAVPEYQAALAVAPGDLRAACGLGESLTKLNRLPEGINLLRRALSEAIEGAGREAHAKLAALHSHLANGLAMVRNDAEAIEHYEAAIRLNPTGGQGSDHFNLALLLAVSGRREEARRMYEAAIAINPELREKRALLTPYLGD
jgi:tetratricopeptide (TPR) repeat protein